ncbi:MAG: hypothetical protein Q8L22_26070 [Reyranella sp.]|nr:hypothetical protein [Reyranella sp.]
MNHFEILEATAREARQHVRRLRYTVPRGQQEDMLGTLENLIAATATTARICQRELKLLRSEFATAMARIEGLERAALPSPA